MGNDPKLGSVWSYIGLGTDSNELPKIITIKLIAKNQRGSYKFDNLIGKSRLTSYLVSTILNKLIWHPEDPNDIKGSKYWRKNNK